MYTELFNDFKDIKLLIELFSCSTVQEVRALALRSEAQAALLVKLQKEPEALVAVVKYLAGLDLLPHIRLLFILR